MSDVAVPEYMTKYYRRAYVRPWAVRFFDRQVCVNLILSGNYNRLRDLTLRALGERLPGRTLQIACCYGNLTPHVVERVVQGGGSLDVIDVLQIQLDRLASKLPSEAPVSLTRMDSSALSMQDATYDRVFMFFLTHEQPPEYRKRTVAEALRVLKPGGRIVIADYAQHVWWHPLKPYLLLVSYLKPFVRDVWKHPLSELLPAMRTTTWPRSSCFGGLFQVLVSEK